MKIIITGIRQYSGNVVVEIYRDENSWLKIPFRKEIVNSENERVNLIFSLPYGKYAVTVYQDLNNNGEADMNFLGIPKELVGFGNNYKPFGEPDFKSCLVIHSLKVQPEPIRLYKVF